MKHPQLICICGATATGKTDLAFDLAQELKTEIISFDSVQVYKQLDIGTAKPSPELRSKVRHHLIDCIEPTEAFTAGDFKRRATEIILEHFKNKDHVIFVGGTGFYLRALLRGMYEIPEVSATIKDQVAKELENRGASALYDELKNLDSAYAEKIHVNDTYRLCRAFELLRSGAKSVTEIKNKFKSQPPPNPVKVFGLNRVKGRLKELIDQRAEKMINDGLVEETRALLEKYPEGLRPLESVGYKETQMFLRGEIDQKALKGAIVKSTMLLAKRQNTWFKRDAQIRWFDPDEFDSGAALLDRFVKEL